MNHVSLDTVRAGWRFQRWQETFNSIHPRSSASVADETQFHGQISWRRMADLLLCDISSAAQKVRRQSSHIRQGEPEVIELHMHLEGEGKIIQDGRECMTRAGEIVLYDSGRPYELIFEHPFRLLYINIPKELFRGRLGLTEHVTARSISGMSGLGRFLAGYISELVLRSEEDDMIAANGLRQHLADLLITAVSSLPQTSGKTAGFCRAMTLCRAKAYIAENLSDEALSPTSVAQALGVSRRYLYDLFTDEGMPVAHWIKQSRLERCRSDIESSALTTRSLSGIAYSWGFSDAAHFSRAFRDTFGMSPKDCRMAKRAPKVTALAHAQHDKL